MQLHMFMNPIFNFIHKQYVSLINRIIQEFMIEMEHLSLKQTSLRKLVVGEQFFTQS
jgi:hypothetical protein